MAEIKRMRQVRKVHSGKLNEKAKKNKDIFNSVAHYSLSRNVALHSSSFAIP